MDKQSIICSFGSVEGNIPFSQDEKEQVEDVEEVVCPDRGDQDELLHPRSFLFGQGHQVHGTLTE